MPLGQRSYTYKGLVNDVARNEAYAQFLILIPKCMPIENPNYPNGILFMPYAPCKCLL